MTEHYELYVSCQFLDEFEQRHRDSSSEVVFVLLRPDNRMLLQTKSFYPKGTYRIPSGKLHPGEDPVVGARREIAEETGLHPAEVCLLGEITYTLRCPGREAPFRSYIFLCSETDEWPVCTDEREQVTGFREVPIDDLPGVAEHLRSLPGTWSDWGRFRAIVHDFGKDFRGEGQSALPPGTNV